MIEIAYEIGWALIAAAVLTIGFRVARLFVQGPERIENLDDYRNPPSHE